MSKLLPLRNVPLLIASLGSRIDTHKQFYVYNIQDDHVNTFIALFRGINVGGHNKLPMRELVQVLNELGLQNIETYIQSGNVVFESEETDNTLLSGRIRNAISQSHGFKPEAILLKADEFETALESNPYPEAEGEPKALHLFFLGSEPQDPDMNKLEALRHESESYTLMRKIFYLYAPDGIGRSKVAAGVEKALGVSATARNWRSVCQIKAMANK
jgi:uncharacterized protein (DUF1697 family)